MDTKLKEFDLSAESFREVYYVKTGDVYTIQRPIKLFIREGGATHRVLDEFGLVHCYPAPESGLTVIRWRNKVGFEPCQF